MKPITFLFAAYIATWVIHASYLGTLVRRFSRLRQQLRELGKDGGSGSSAASLYH